MDVGMTGTKNGVWGMDLGTRMCNGVSASKNTRELVDNSQQRSMRFINGDNMLPFPSPLHSWWQSFASANRPTLEADVM